MKKTITAVAMDLLSAEVQASFWRLQCKPCLGKVEFHNTRGLLLPHEQTENVVEEKGVGLWKKRKTVNPRKGKSSLLLLKVKNSLYIFQNGQFLYFLQRGEKGNRKGNWGGNSNSFLSCCL